MSKSLDGVVKHAKRAAAVTAGLVGSVLSSGCLEGDPGAALFSTAAVVGGYNRDTATTQKQAAGWNAYSNLGGAMAQRQNAIDAARAGQTTVVVQQGNNQDNKPYMGKNGDGTWSIFDLNPNYGKETRNKVAVKELPLLFTCGGGINAGEEYTEIGKTYLKEGEKIHVVGRAPLRTKKLYNYRICVTTGVTFARREKPDRGEACDLIATFGSKGEHDYCPKGTWENVWEEQLPDGSFKEIGRVRWTYLY